MDCKPLVGKDSIFLKRQFLREKMLFIDWDNEISYVDEEK